MDSEKEKCHTEPKITNCKICGRKVMLFPIYSKASNEVIGFKSKSVADNIDNLERALLKKYQHTVAAICDALEINSLSDALSAIGTLRKYTGYEKDHNYEVLEHQYKHDDDCRMTIDELKSE